VKGIKSGVAVWIPVRDIRVTGSVIGNVDIVGSVHGDSQGKTQRGIDGAAVVAAVPDRPNPATGCN
jgi:hypothetical protein